MLLDRLLAPIEITLLHVLQHVYCWVQWRKRWAEIYRSTMLPVKHVQFQIW